MALIALSISCSTINIRLLRFFADLLPLFSNKTGQFGNYVLWVLFLEVRNPLLEVKNIGSNRLLYCCQSFHLFSFIHAWLALLLLLFWFFGDFRIAVIVGQAKLAEGHEVLGHH